MNVIEKLKLLQANAGPDIKVFDITVGDTTQQFNIKRLSFAETQSVGGSAFVENDEGGLKINIDKVTERSAQLISFAVVEDDGTRALTVEQVKALDSSIATQLLAAVNQFNGFTKKPVESAAKNSFPTATTATS